MLKGRQKLCMEMGEAKNETSGLQWRFAWGTVMLTMHYSFPQVKEVEEVF